MDDKEILTPDEDIEVEIYQEVGRMISVLYTTDEIRIEGL